MATGERNGNSSGKAFSLWNEWSIARYAYPRTRLRATNFWSVRSLWTETPANYLAKLLDPSYKLRLGFRLIDSNPAANFLLNFRTIMILSSDSDVKQWRNDFDREPWVFEFSPVSTNSSYLTAKLHRRKQFPIRASKPSNIPFVMQSWYFAIN